MGVCVCWGAEAKPDSRAEVTDIEKLAQNYRFENRCLRKGWKGGLLGGSGLRTLVRCAGLQSVHSNHGKKEDGLTSGGEQQTATRLGPHRVLSKVPEFTESCRFGTRGFARSSDRFLSG